MTSKQNDLLPPSAPDMTEAELVRCEDTIRRGKDAFIEVGQALIEIRDRRGYKARGFKTFEDYSEKVWGFSDRHARRLMSGAETSQTVKRITGETPANEAVAREFAKVADDPRKVEKVAAKLKTRGGSVATATAERVAEVVAQVTGKSKPAEPSKTAPKPTAPPPTFTDECPACGQVPDSYERKGGGWQCGACAAPVFVGVVSATVTRTCKSCHTPLKPSAVFCPNCGEVL